MVGESLLSMPRELLGKETLTMIGEVTYTGAAVAVMSAEEEATALMTAAA